LSLWHAEADTGPDPFLQFTVSAVLDDALGHWLLNNFGNQLWGRVYQTEGELPEK